MALKQLLLARQIGELRGEREDLEAKVAEVGTRRAAWSEREAAAEAALSEINDETGAEERAAFDAEAAEIEKEDGEIRTEEEALASRAAEIDGKIAELEKELETINKRAEEVRKSAPSAAKNNTEGGVENMQYTDERQSRAAQLREIVKNDEVRNFLGVILEKRAVAGATYTIPTVMQPLIIEAVKKNTKLYKHVNVSRIKGDGAFNVLAAAPEAVWTATTGRLNELTMTLNQFLTHGSKVAGYIPVSNAYLEDSVEDLAGIVIDLLGQSIGYVLDKAILYGTGSNMPIGIVTRLAATSSPAWWQASMPTFTDLHATHIGKLSAATVKGADLYKELIAVLGTAEQKHIGDGDLFWAMNQATWMKLQGELVSINAAGAVVTGANMVMPVIGGQVELLDFIPANNIVGGWGQEYKLVERKGIAVSLSEHAQFIEDNTVYKGVARYDGNPYCGEGFAAFSLTTTDVTTSITFATDSANAVGGES